MQRQGQGPEIQGRDWECRMGIGALGWEPGLQDGDQEYEMRSRALIWGPEFGMAVKGMGTRDMGWEAGL